MALTKYNGATNTIQSLSDRPNQNEGLTAAQLKLKFDQEAINNKAFINNTLTVEIDDLDLENVKKTDDQTIDGVKTFIASPIVPTPTTNMQASTKKYVDDVGTSKTNDLNTHKTSSDHDGRYYTEAEVAALLALKTNLTGDHQGTWQGYSPTLADPGIASVVAGHTAQLADIENINIMPQAPLPAKQGVSTNSPKLFIKIDSLHYEVIQKADEGYLRYKLHKANGDTSISYGGNWELLRLLAVQQLLDVFVWKEPIPVTGTLTTSVAASTFNTIESNLTYKAPSTVEGNRTGLSLYDLAAGTEATFTLGARKKGMANILFNANTGRSTKMEIYVNDYLVKSFSSNLGGLVGNYQIVEFPIPSTANSSETFTVKIKNTDTVKFSIVCFNFFRLEDYDGQEIDSYKLYLMNSYFINETGASDYALRHKDTNKWFGSYHGGEVAEFLKGTWNSTLKQGDDIFADEIDLNSIANGSYTIVKNLIIRQKTKLITIADMISSYDFNINGTMNMSFSLTNCTVPLMDLYTALTCTHTDFTEVSYPESKLISLNADNLFKIQNGYVEQRTPDNTRKIGIRFCMFNNKYNTKGPFIRNNSSYSKFYYGIVCEYSPGIVIPNLTFQKALDFYNLKI